MLVSHFMSCVAYVSNKKASSSGLIKSGIRVIPGTSISTVLEVHSGSGGGVEGFLMSAYFIVILYPSMTSGCDAKYATALTA